MSFDEQPDGDIHADDPANYSAEGVQCYLFALLDEANRRGGMFPQTGDEQRSDSKAVHRVCEMVDWYARSGEPKPKQIDRLLKLRARNKMTNRETDGDIHCECAAESEPSELSAFEKWWAMLSKVPYMSKKEIADRAFYAGEMASYELRFDACRPYLKEGETPAECLARNRADIVRLMGKWGAEKMRSAKLRDDLDKIAQTTGSDDPCRPHLKEGESPAEGLARFRSKITDIFGRWTLFMDAQKAALTEGGKMISSDRYKQIMAGLGMPNSQSLLCALQQVANEVGQKYSADAIALADAADRACARASISDLNWQRVSHDKESLQDQLDDCRPYLKDGETAADALRRLSNNNSSVLSWNGHNIYGDVDSLRDARDAIEYKAARIADSAAKLWPDEGIT